MTSALRNAVREDRVGHAYLFSGPRGTGKTTSARVLAKALNCLNLQDGEPCGECENCKSIAAGSFVDLFEIDAASNNSVNDIRSLIERVNLGLGPTSKKKVYIIDEVHMLSSSANAAAPNALLKTLEEPPSHVVFVLATTNPEKVLPTIRSRTQHFEFSLLSLDQLVEHLAEIAKLENIDADHEALEVIARRGAGSPRDALSLMDQALAHFGKELRAGPVADLFGGSPVVQRLEILRAIANGDSAESLVALTKLLESGHEPRRVAEDLLKSLRDAFLLSAAAGRVDVQAPPEEREQLTDVAKSMGNSLLVRSLEMLGEAIVDMRGTNAADPRLVLEIAVLRLARRDSETSSESQPQPERISVPKAEAAPRDPEPASADAGPAAARKALGAIKRTTPVVNVSLPEPVPEKQAPVTNGDLSDGEVVNIDDVILVWADIVSALSVASRSVVQEAQPLSVEGDVIVFGMPPKLISAARPRFQKEADTIREALAAKLGRRMLFKVVATEELTAAPATVDLTNEPPAYVEPHEILDEVPAAPNDPMQHLMTQFGASVVEERTNGDQS